MMMMLCAWAAAWAAVLLTAPPPHRPTVPPPPRHTVIVIKPDGLGRALEAELVRAVRQNFRIKHIKYFLWDGQLVDAFYSEHRSKAFFPELKASLVNQWSIGMVVGGGGDAVRDWRARMEELRSKHALDQTRNTLHGSDSASSALREQQLLFA